MSCPWSNFGVLLLNGEFISYAYTESRNSPKSFVQQQLLIFLSSVQGKDHVHWVELIFRQSGFSFTQRPTLDGSDDILDSVVFFMSDTVRNSERHVSLLLFGDPLQLCSHAHCMQPSSIQLIPFQTISISV